MHSFNVYAPELVEYELRLVLTIKEWDQFRNQLRGMAGVSLGIRQKINEMLMSARRIFPDVEFETRKPPVDVLAALSPDFSLEEI